MLALEVVDAWESLSDDNIEDEGREGEEEDRDPAIATLDAEEGVGEGKEDEEFMEMNCWSFSGGEKKKMKT